MLTQGNARRIGQSGLQASGSVRRLVGGLAVGAFMLAAIPALGDDIASGTTDEQAFFEEKCGFCHTSQRIFLNTLSAEQRRHIVVRMRDRWEGGKYWLSDEDIDRIMAYVDTRVDSGESVASSSASGEPKELFRERCTGCHELDRVYAQVKSERGKPAAWLHVVTRMRSKAPDWISEEEAEQIIHYLRERTTPKSTP